MGRDVTADYCDQVFEGFSNDLMPEYPDLKGKTVFITGGGSGIGAYFAAAFALQGAKVAFVSLSEGPANHICDAIEEKSGYRPLFIQCDIRDIEALKEAIVEAEKALGPVDVLINNAARDLRHKITDFTPAQWGESLDTNLKPHFFTAQAVAEGMITRKVGVIINVGSNSANLGLSGYPAYVAAKAGIVGLTKALATELGPHNIRVNALVPGWVLTERQQRLWVTDKALQECLDQQSIKRPMHGWDIALPALFLASSGAAMLTGQEIIVDGGRV
ncbi:SDR family oxidoreductase [Kordiimonas sp. SCSIO 12603]|uniref:SDR family NAD(P)-dependent oxidoreductase n=1 Tax=Kordiimonas sp. SCSIO 12603 TaxID=2829596 RepID=UPI002101F70A|nr:SDR family oxidoreductase [Kordiimonas sp. SCSIO 12603]UTW58941.1 SDR family oxidoreductase [Kordiimonas sp. SCSIO 12603]